MKPLRGLYLAGKNLGLTLLCKDIGGPPQPKRCPPSFHEGFDGANKESTSSEPCIRVLSRFLLNRFGHDCRLRLEDFNEELQLIRLC